METPHYDIVPKGLDENLRFREEMLTLAGEDESAAAGLRQMCSEDMLFYVNTFCWTYSPKDKSATGSVVPFITYPDFQDEAMLGMADCILKGRDFAVPKSRDMGASWMGLTVFEWFWHFKENQSFLLISRNEDYVDKSGNPKSLFWKVDFLHRNQPRWLLPEGRWLGQRDPNRRLLHLRNADNDSVIDGESTTGDAGRGDRRTAMFVDEHAAFEVNDGFRVLRATRDTTRCRGFNSTPQGANNAFYEVVHNTNAQLIRLHWSKHPEKSLGLYKFEKESGEIDLLDDFNGMVEVRAKGEKDSEWVVYPDQYPFIRDGKLRSPWYDGECARCVSAMEIGQELDIDFLGSDYQFFDAEIVQILIKKYCRDPVFIGELEFDYDSCDPKRLVESPHGRLMLWIDVRHRMPRDRRFAVGADVSAGTGASNSVSCVVDIGTGEKVGVWRHSHTRPNPFAKQTIALARFFNNALLNWDASGATGSTFTRRVLASGYGHLYYRRYEKKVGQKLTDEPGYYLNSQARTALFEDYREALGEHKYINYSNQGMKECLQFIRKPDGTIEHSESLYSQDPSGARTAHGDEVVADALACLNVSSLQEMPKSKEPEIVPGCLAWRMKQRELKRSRETADVLDDCW